MRAAPVGVVVSCGSSTQRTSEPFRTSSVAGPGEGRGPWAASTTPLPRGRGPQLTDPASSSSSPTQLPTMSTMESTAPTSWKVTSSARLPWTAPSATARRQKTSMARADARSFYERADVLEGAVDALLWMAHHHHERLDAADLYPLGREVERDAEALERCDDLLRRRPGGDEASEGHVASHATNGLEVDVLHFLTRARPRRALLVSLSSVGDLARSHQGGGEGDGEQDQGPRVALYGVGEG